jgi:serine/threonine protein kinase
MRTLTFKRLIGSGGMGTVYEAELGAPRGFCRPCAVKVMKSASTDHEHFMARMRDEARLLGMLQDEQILGVTELVMVDGRDAVVMEYVEGVDLADIIKEHRVPPRALAELSAEIAGTLYKAHVARHPQSGQPLNVIHRDVKPANVMITARGGIRLLDFGVARAVFASRESQTQGLVLGTLNYFPPEILAGHDPTSAVDVYGLGITIWECATGKEWGSPQVKKERFERRVNQRMGQMTAEYDHVVPVLRDILSWDPMDRPDGGQVERAMLACADNLEGEGLRTWARRVVPPMIVSMKVDAQRDALVGRKVIIATPVEELAVDEMLVAPNRIPDPTAVTYDEMRSPFAPPEDEDPAPAAESARAGGSATEATPAQPRKKKRKNRKSKVSANTLWLALAVFFLVLAAGLALLVAVGVVAYVVWF